MMMTDDLSTNSYSYIDRATFLTGFIVPLKQGGAD